MDWFRSVNNYCERVDATYWSEPLNAVSNASFPIAAFVCWRMLRRSNDRGARLLVVVLAMIGVGSYLFHTHAQVWASIADVLPILAFILVYIYLATVRYFQFPVWAGLLAAAAYVPFSTAVSSLVEALAGGLNGSVSYLPVVVLIAAYAFLLRHRAPATARGLALGAAVLSVSLIFRSIDEAVCEAIPAGTHFLWHLLNGAMLGWMIIVLVRHGEAPLRGGTARAKARPL